MKLSIIIPAYNEQDTIHLILNSNQLKDLQSYQIFQRELYLINYLLLDL